MVKLKLTTLVVIAAFALAQKSSGQRKPITKPNRKPLASKKTPVFPSRKPTLPSSKPPTVGKVPAKKQGCVSTRSLNLLVFVN